MAITKHCLTLKHFSGTSTSTKVGGSCCWLSRRRQSRVVRHPWHPGPSSEAGEQVAHQEDQTSSEIGAETIPGRCEAGSWLAWEARRGFLAEECGYWQESSEGESLWKESRNVWGSCAGKSSSQCSTVLLTAYKLLSRSIDGVGASQLLCKWNFEVLET